MFKGLSHIRRNLNLEFRIREQNNSKFEQLFRMGAAVARPVLRLTYRRDDSGISGVIPGKVK